MRPHPRAVALASLLALAALGAEPPKSEPALAAQRQVGAGGDSGPKPKASLSVEAEETAEQAPPPAPQGDERRAIGDYIRDNSADVRECYAKRLQDRPTLQGKVVVRFDIGPRGKVIGASADGVADRALLLCVVGAVRRVDGTSA